LTSTEQRAPTSSAADWRRLEAAIVLVFLGALGLRLWGFNFGLPALYRPDEDVTVGRAMGMLRGVFDPHFADWPHLYFNLSAAWLGLLRLAGLINDQASGYLGVRLLDALLGSLTVIVVFVFGRRAYGLLAGFFAAGATAVAFLQVRDSHFATLDVPLTLAIVAGLYVAYGTLGMREWRPLVLNGIALGIATSLKYNGGLLITGIAAAQLLRSRAQETGIGVVVRRLVAIGVIGLVTLVITSPFLLLDPAMTQHGLGYIFFHLQKSTAPSIGWVELGRALWYGIDPALLLGAVVGAVYAAWRREPADWILLTFVVTYFVLIGAGGSVFFRYADPLIPPLLLLAGRVLAALVEQTPPGRVRWVAFASALTIITVPSIAHDVRYDLLIQQTDTRTLAFDWLARYVTPGSRAAVPYMAGPAHDQAMIDSGEHSHAATDAYVASFLDSRLETQYTIHELTAADMNLTSLASFRQEGIHYVVVGYEKPGTGCRVESPLERVLQQQAQLVTSFSPTNGCPSSVFDPIDTYYVPLAGYGEWLRPGPPIRIYKLSS
jgi:dolichyl-phosphate-mannose-protein mannosyltransferase